jgi:hypothetical protein
MTTRWRMALLTAVLGGILLAARGPEALAQSAGVCLIHGDKVASPTRVLLGESVRLTLTLTPECPPAVYRKADIVLIIDRSLSMADSNKLTDAKAAARSFVDQTDLGLHQIGLVAFANDVFTAPMRLSQDKAKILQAIDDIEIRPGTDISSAIDAAQALLQADGRTGALPVIILMSDGTPNSPSPEPRAAAVVSANFAKLAGTQIFTIGLGRDTDAELMQSLASSPQQYYYAPTGDQLADIYEQIAVVVGTSVVKDLVLSDVLSTPVDLVASSMQPAGDVTGKSIVWKGGLLPSSGLTWTYDVKPNRAGTFPTNDHASVDYTNADGSRGTFVFPQPQITVVDPNAKPPCTKADYTILVQAFPDVVGVGVGPGQQGCNNRLDSGDWIGGSIPSMPLLEFQLLSSDSQSVLFQGKAVRGAGRIDQRLYIPACGKPPWRLRLVTTQLDGWLLCNNSPVERLITADLFRNRPLRSIEFRYGFVR